MGADRKTPQSEEAEYAVLGSMLADAESMVPMARLVKALKPECFVHPQIRLVVEAIYEMFDKRQPVDLLTVGNRIGDDDIRALCMQALDAALTPANAEFYMQIVAEKYMARELIRVAKTIEDEAYTAESPDALAAKAPQLFVDIVAGVPKQEVTNEQRLDESVATWHELAVRRQRGEFNVLRGLPTPFPCMDQWTSGWQPGLIILAGRPSAGKTTMEDHMVMRLVTQGHPVARVALDMSPSVVLERTCCRMAEVSLPKLNKGYATLRNLEDIELAKKNIQNLPIHLNNRDRDVRSICTWARNMHRRHGIKMLTVDFVQLLTYQNPGKFMDRNSEMGQISGMLKNLSFELNIPVILLSQMSRGSEKESRIPQLSDLRDSGSLEQDASVVLFVYLDPKNPETMINEYAVRRNVWVHCLKNQNGQVSRQAFYLYAHYFKFEEADVKDFGGGDE